MLGLVVGQVRVIIGVLVITEAVVVEVVLVVVVLLLLSRSGKQTWKESTVR